MWHDIIVFGIGVLAVAMWSPTAGKWLAWTVAAALVFRHWDAVRALID